MQRPFLMATLEGMEHGTKGDWIAQNPVDNEQWPIAQKTFTEMYELAEQVLPSTSTATSTATTKDVNNTTSLVSPIHASANQTTTSTQPSQNSKITTSTKTSPTKSVNSKQEQNSAIQESKQQADVIKPLPKTRHNKVERET